MRPPLAAGRLLAGKRHSRRRVSGKDPPRRGRGRPRTVASIPFNDRSVRSFVWASTGRTAGFFVVHYGGVRIAHGVFVPSVFELFPDLAPAAPRVIGVATLGLLAHHVVSYRIDHLGEREHEPNGPVTLMVESYRRVFGLHRTVVLGAFAVAAIGAPVGALAVTVLAKTVTDVRGHWREHDRARRWPRSWTPPEAPRRRGHGTARPGPP